MFHVKQKPKSSRRLFHVKHPCGLHPDTEIPEDHVEDILHIDSARESSQGTGSQPQILGNEFVAVSPVRTRCILPKHERPAQTLDGICETGAMTLPCYQGILGTGEIRCCLAA